MTLFYPALLLLATPPAPSVPIAQRVMLTDVSSQAGLVVPQRESTRQCKIFNDFRCEMEHMSGGAATADVDGDGWMDLYLTRIDRPDGLYLNARDGTFVDVTEASGLMRDSQSNGAIFADLDNDGDQDLIVTVFGAAGDAANSHHQIWINDGAGGFVEEGLGRGMRSAGASSINGWSIALGDLNRDGWIDYFISQWAEDPTPSGRLYINRGDSAPGHFLDATERMGLDVSGVSAFAPAFVDLDGDGWQDLAIAADFGTSRLFWNEAGSRLVDGTRAAGVGTDENGMGSAFGDFDADGDLDWLVTSIYDPFFTCETSACNWRYSGNRLFRNEGQRRFSDATDAAGVRDGAWGWGAAWIDLDHDGQLDLIQTNGVRFPTLAASPFFRDATRVWLQTAPGGFDEVASRVGLHDSGSGKGLLTFDYDRDGDLDVLIAQNAEPPLLLRNDQQSPGHWLRVRVLGTASNRDGLGAIVTVHGGGRTWRQEIGVQTHFLGGSELTAHFGLGQVVPERLVVRFPRSGVERTLTQPSVDRVHLVVE